ncbi:MAG: sulfatase [Candidatus Omnitrophota bacterium]|jgi:arylsulfatase A-like enzyme
MTINRKHLLSLLCVIFIALVVYILYALNRPKPYNLVVITIDALRPDHLGCYGYERETSPCIDRIAESGVLFTQAISQAPETGASIPFLMSSLYPSQHGIRRPSEVPLTPSSTLGDILKKDGYHTAAIVAHAEQAWVTKGFDYTYFNIEGSAAQINREAIAWLEKNKDRRLFLWLHYFDAHAPYLNPDPAYQKLFLPPALKDKGAEYFEAKYYWVAISEKDQLRAEPYFVTFPSKVKARDEKELRRKIRYFKDTPGFLDAVFPLFTKQALDGNISKEDKDYYISQYDGGIRLVDDYIAVFLNELERQGLLKNTLIVLTADHGENLADYSNNFYHGDSLYDVLLKVPLIIKGPGLPEGRTIKRQVQSIDIMPTILDILNIKGDPRMEGNSLCALISGKAEGWPEHAFSENLHEGYEMQSIRSEDWKLIHNLNKDTYELYDLKNDPYERSNMAYEKDKISRSLKSRLEQWIESIGAPGRVLDKGMDPESMEKLMSLGYAIK